MKRTLRPDSRSCLVITVSSAVRVLGLDLGEGLSVFVGYGPDYYLFDG